MRRFFPIAAALAAAATFTTAAAAGNHYTDPTGDSGAAPDITAVDITNDAADNATFTVTMAPRPTGYAPDEQLQLHVDADQNPATGSPAGTEFLFVSTGQGWGLLQWDGSEFSQAPTTTAHVTASVTSTAFTIAFAINKSELGNTNAFNFWVTTTKGTGADTDPFDTAPDGTAVYTYTYAAPATVQSITAKVPKTARPRHVVALSNFGVSLSDGTSAKPTAVACKATFRGNALKNAGGCSFAVPKTAAGKSIVVTVTVTYGGQAYSTKYTIHVAKK